MSTPIEEYQSKSIEAFSQTGHGLSTVLKGDSSKNVLVPFTIPDENVSFSTARYKSKKEPDTRLVATNVVLIKSSPDRRKPVCIHFGECGGCTWQHIAYERQLQEKERRIKNQFSCFSYSPDCFDTIIPSPLEFEYRNKMEYTFSQDAKFKKFLGLHLRSASRRVFDVTECHLVPPWFAQTLEIVRQWWDNSTLLAYKFHSNEGALRTIAFRHGFATDERMIILTVSGNSEFAIKKHILDEFVQNILKGHIGKEDKVGIILRIHQIAKGMQTQFYEINLYGLKYITEKIILSENRSLELQLSPCSFFQPNSLQANTIYQKALELAKLSQDSIVYDLYCGIGGFGLSASYFSKHVYACEISKDAVFDARTNAERLGISNYTIECGDVHVVLQQNIESGQWPKPDVIFIDPPRSGLDHKAIAQLGKLLCQTIVYISCNPKTQCENVKQLLEFGYAITKIAPIDQFPHTLHVENICVLTKH